MKAVAAALEVLYGAAAMGRIWLEFAASNLKMAFFGSLTLFAPSISYSIFGYGLLGFALGFGVLGFAPVALIQNSRRSRSV